MKAALLASAVLAVAGVVFYFGTTVGANASGPESSERRLSAQRSAVSKQLSSQSLSLPLFFEPNQGQTAPQVKFLARGAGYGLFLTADEAVLNLHRLSPAPRTATAPRPAPTSVIRMKLDGANSAARVSGAEPLPGKSNYFIGNDPAKWRHNIPQFARVEYKSVYPGVDLVYYGDQGQLEYDFRVVPGAEPNQIVLSFQGASTRIESGDLMLSTDQGDVRFHAPRVYQQDGNAQRTIAGSFRQLADNKIGFTIGAYDHSRELVIDPVLSYSTYIGGSNGIESFVNVAVDSAGFIYLAGATTSNDFPLASAPPAPLQSQLAGTQNIFIAVINPSPQPGNSQLVYATYLGGSGSDFPAGIAVSTNLDQFTTGIDIYVAGTTSSPNFPTDTSGSSGLKPFQGGPPTDPPPTDPGNHGFVTRLNVPTFGTQGTSTTLRYSTYLAGTNAAGTATDTVTGLAIDNAGDAFVTGVTTSTNDTSVGFPANPNAFQIQSNAPSQFFASEINTKGTGSGSMIYSTYLGGGNYAGPLTIVGGGIAIDSTSSPNMYITGGTNFLPVDGPNGPRFPLNAAYQSCLDESGQTGCTSSSTPTKLDAFVAKITPRPGFTLPVYCTYLGGSDDDIGFGIAVDSSGNAYVTGSTLSGDWTSTGSGFQTSYGGSGDAFIAKIGNLTGSIYPLTYFTYLGGSGVDVGRAIQVDSVQAVHVVGSTTSTSPSFPITTNTLQPQNGGGGDAFVAVIGTTLSGKGAGDYVTFLGGTGTEQGTGVAIDPVFGATYVAGTTTSPNFPTKNPYQDHLNGSQNAFVSKIGASSVLTVTPSTTSPAPNPVAAGTQVAFTFNIGNTGPDTASQVVFTAGNLPTSGLATSPTAKVTSGTGSCNPVQGPTITCFIPTLAVCSTTPCTSATVEVDVTPAITAIATGLTQIQVSGQATANNSGAVFVCTTCQTPANIVDFTVTASTTTPTINAGDTAAIQVAFCPATTHGYNATITPSQTASPSIVTATGPTFTPSSVTLTGSSCGTTTLRIPTVARPVTTGSVFRRGSFYAAWLPIGGLSLVGLGIGAGRKRRRWLAAVVLGVIAGAILLQSGCGSSSSSVTPGGGTQAGTYTITIAGSAGTGAAHNTTVTLFVR